MPARKEPQLLYISAICMAVHMQTEDAGKTHRACSSSHSKFLIQPKFLICSNGELP